MRTRERRSSSVPAQQPETPVNILKLLRARAVIAGLFIAACLPAYGVSAQQRGRAQRPSYFPAAGTGWERRSAQQLDLDSAGIAAAVAFAIERESPAPRNLEEAHKQSFGREPHGEAVGPFRPRGDPTGIIVRRGYIVAEWGDPERVDMTFSVSKSFLSSTVGIAFDRGMIRSLQDTVRNYMSPVLVLGADGSPARSALIEPFETPHNRRITWEHLLRQTSDWEGTLWGKPEWADRPSRDTAHWATRNRVDPGTVYEYNDVRVNALALAALNVWRRPLPEVLREHVMDPIGASSTWRWFGYETSWVEIDGKAVQSVSGGGHWGGGMFISARDQARFGLLTLHQGRWKDRQILSERFVSQALRPTTVEPTYGFMNWFVNTERKLLPSAPASAFMHLGNGTNMIYVDAENDLVIVARWIRRDALDGLVQRVLSAVKAPAPSRVRR